jgi:hypothetical protein
MGVPGGPKTHILSTDQILLPRDPEEDMEAATKHYVDSNGGSEGGIGGGISHVILPFTTTFSVTYDLDVSFETDDVIFSVIIVNLTEEKVHPVFTWWVYDNILTIEFADDRPSSGSSCEVRILYLSASSNGSGGEPPPEPPVSG